MCLKIQDEVFFVMNTIKVVELFVNCSMTYEQMFYDNN